LGKATGPLSRCAESPNDFLWSFTRPVRFQGKGHMTVPFRITGYEPIQDTAAFENLCLEDARWMGRLIGQLTERQIIEALTASGSPSAEVRLYAAKLIRRRDRMIRDLGLSDEFAPLAADDRGRRLSYDPAQDGPVRVRTRAGTEVTAPVGRFRVVHGRL